MDTVCPRSHDRPSVPLCPSCSRPMRFVRAIPRFAALPELRTYECKGCAVTFTEEAVADRDDEIDASAASAP